MEDPFQREMVGVRIYDLVIDFWEESCEALDRILQKVHLPSVAGRLAQLSSMMSTN